MQLRSASQPAPDRRAPAVNEDLVVTGPDFVVVLDGASAPARLDSGCEHTVAWLVGHLGAQLAAPLLTRSAAPLAELLAAAITAVCDRHADTCDLANPDSPSSTVSMVRLIGDRVDHLVLADSPVALRSRDRELSVIVDTRVDELPSYTLEAVRRLRNHPDGFWAASTRPEAASEAITGSTDRSEVDLVALLTDGASRYADRYGHSWPDLVEVLETGGPQRLIDEVRAADRAALADTFRGKRYDDATAVVWQLT